MRLAEAVRLAQDEPLTFPRPLLSEPRVARAAAALEARMERIGRLEPLDVAALRRRLEREPDLSTLGPRDFKHVAHLLWESPPLAADADFVARYLAELRRRESGPALRRLALLWLLDFSADAPAIAEIADLLRAEMPRLRGALSDPAIGRRVLDPVAGPPALAKRLAEASVSPAEVLERHGLKGPVAEGGLVLAAFRALLARLGREMATARAPYLPLLQRVLDLAKDHHGAPRFEQARAAFAEALLCPFMVADPPPETRELIESEVLARLGDPRLAGGRWAGVSEAAKEVMLRWLAEATLEAFIAVVRKHADAGHWVYREAFWRAYLKAGHVRDVQVALAPDARREAQAMARRENDPRLRIFARLEGSGVLPNHAVLLLRIGDLTLAEWSHSGALRVWKPGQRGAPRLERRGFDTVDLRDRAATRFVHHGSAAGSWQAAVVQTIGRETGIAMNRSDYMPRR